MILKLEEHYKLSGEEEVDISFIQSIGIDECSQCFVKTQCFTLINDIDSEPICAYCSLKNIENSDCRRVVNIQLIKE